MAAAWLSIATKRNVAACTDCQYPKQADRCTRTRPKVIAYIENDTRPLNEVGMQMYEHHGLTNAQARMARQIIDWAVVTQAAAHLGVTSETPSSRLKAVSPRLTPIDRRNW